MFDNNFNGNGQQNTIIQVIYQPQIVVINSPSEPNNKKVDKRKGKGFWQYIKQFFTFIFNFIRKLLPFIPIMF
jgi:hypothetical protein